MKESEKENSKSRKRLFNLSDWSMDDTLFLSGIVLAFFTTILCFIL
jgi:hypothetical protein